MDSFYYRDFFSLIYIFCAAIASKKHKLKRGVTALVSSQNDKGTISASNDHFARGDWGEFQDKHPCSSSFAPINVKPQGGGGGGGADPGEFDILMAATVKFPTPRHLLKVNFPPLG